MVVIVLATIVAPARPQSVATPQAFGKEQDPNKSGAGSGVMLNGANSVVAAEYLEITCQNLLARLTSPGSYHHLCLVLQRGTRDY